MHGRLSPTRCALRPTHSLRTHGDLLWFQVWGPRPYQKSERNKKTPYRPWRCWQVKRFSWVTFRRKLTQTIRRLSSLRWLQISRFWWTYRRYGFICEEVNMDRTTGVQERQDNPIDNTLYGWGWYTGRQDWDHGSWVASMLRQLNVFEAEVRGGV